jgi:hypothetical protein
MSAIEVLTHDSSSESILTLYWDNIVVLKGLVLEHLWDKVDVSIKAAEAGINDNNQETIAGAINQIATIKSMTADSISEGDMAFLRGKAGSALKDAQEGLLGDELDAKSFAEVVARFYDPRYQAPVAPATVYTLHDNEIQQLEVKDFMPISRRVIKL